jgi:ATP-dependent RNA helicase HrpB
MKSSGSSSSFPALPVDEALPEIGAALDRAGTLVLVAEPGAGKTTRVPPFLARRLRGRGRVVVLEPRRIAARNAAARMAEEAGETLGKRFGYQVRGERKFGRETEVLVVTEALLARMLQSDPELKGVSAVVIDEFHERSLHADLALALVAEARQVLRPDLQIVVMSATLDAEPIAAFLGDAPILRVPGRSFPVETRFRPPAGSAPAARRPEERVAPLLPLIDEARAECDGAILVFLPGRGEIEALESILRGRGGRPGVDVQRLHGDLPLQEQRAVLRPPGHPRVVLATNVAESSLTLPDVTAVVDSGWVRRARQDHRLGFDRLELERISRASAEQRGGRAGRLGPGLCLRAWSRAEEATRDAFEPPAIQLQDLSEARLLLLDWGVADAQNWAWFESPPEEALRAADELLIQLGLARREGSRLLLEASGRRLAGVPLHPRLGRMLDEARRAGVGRDGARLAALLSDRDFGRSRGTGPREGRGGRSDLLDRLDRIQGARGGPAGRIESESRRLLDRLPKSWNDEGDAPEGGEEALLRVVLAGFPDRVARRREVGSPQASMVGGRGIELDRDSCVHDDEFFVAVSLGGGRRGQHARDRVRLASGIDEAWLSELFPEQMQRRLEVVFDPKSERLRGVERNYFADLLLREKVTGQIDREQGALVLEQVIREEPKRLFDAVEGLQGFRRRLDLLSEHADEVPHFDEGALIDLIVPVLPGLRGLGELRSMPIMEIVRGSLPQRILQRLDRELPLRVSLPAGGSVAVDYSEAAAPVIRERVQRLFGLWRLPPFLGGRIQPVVELLAPNRRAVQRTTDLESFWRNTYSQVRKDLRGRYPKHDWPEIPPE